MQTYVVAFAIALIISWFLTPYVKNMAVRIGAVDKPDPRRVHKGGAGNDCDEQKGA